MTRLGVVVGLPQEAAILKQALGAAAPPIRCAGSRPDRAASAARELAADGAEILLSFGYAGGLDRDLRAGDILIADGVRAPDGSIHATDTTLRHRLREALGDSRCAHGVIAGSDRVLATVEDKRILASRTGAVAVDMESHAVATAGCRFIVLRVIIDPAHRALPMGILKGLDDRGRVRPLKLIANLLRAPQELPALLALSRDHVAARGSLRRAAAGLRGVLGLA